MAAMLVEYPTIVATPAPVPAAPRRRDARTATWTPRDARGCVVARPETLAADAPAPGADAAGGRHLYWTPRGIAVMVSLVAIVTGVMLATLVMAFLAVSNEPIDAGVSAPLAAAVDGVPAAER